MIAIDTNCLLRRVLNDDAVQLAKVNALFTKPEQILITDVVLVETVWAMQTFAVPKPGRDDIYAMVRSLFDDAKIEFENKHVVWIEQTINTEIVSEILFICNYDSAKAAIWRPGRSPLVF